MTFEFEKIIAVLSLILVPEIGVNYVVVDYANSWPSKRYHGEALSYAP